MAPYFMTVANRRSDPVNDKLIAAGNERVLRARLADAKFFFEQDKKTSLDSQVEKLSAITFYEGLGSVADKAERMAALAGVIANRLDAADRIQPVELQRWLRRIWLQKWWANFPSYKALWAVIMLLLRVRQLMWLTR